MAKRNCVCQLFIKNLSWRSVLLSSSSDIEPIWIISTIQFHVFLLNLWITMSFDEKEILENYKKNLKAVEYVDYIGKVYKGAPEILRFTLIFIDDVLKSGRFKGSSLLDIGSGALVHNIASASAYYPRIVMSDYLEDNCEELKRWLQGRSSIVQFLDVPAELEGYINDLESGKKILQQRIRKCVKQVVRCNVLCDDIFLEDLKDDAAPPYDLIISVYVIETVATDYDSYLRIYRRINKLLRPGGGLITVGCLRGQFWKLKEKDFYHIDIKKEDVLKVLKEAGFGKIDLKTQERLDYDYEYEQMFCVAAEKI